MLRHLKFFDSYFSASKPLLNHCSDKGTVTKFAHMLAAHAQHNDGNALCRLIEVCQHLAGQERKNLGFAMLLLLKYETKDGVWAIIEQVRRRGRGGGGGSRC